MHVLPPRPVSSYFTLLLMHVLRARHLFEATGADIHKLQQQQSPPTPFRLTTLACAVKTHFLACYT